VDTGAPAGTGSVDALSPERPIMRGMLGPNTSQSRIPTRRRRCGGDPSFPPTPAPWSPQCGSPASATAKFTAKLDLPTPPLPEATATRCLIPGNASFPGEGGPTCGRRTPESPSPPTAPALLAPPPPPCASRAGAAGAVATAVRDADTLQRHNAGWGRRARPAPPRVRRRDVRHIVCVAFKMETKVTFPIPRPTCRGGRSQSGLLHERLHCTN